MTDEFAGARTSQIQGLCRIVAPFLSGFCFPYPALKLGSKALAKLCKRGDPMAVA